LKALNSNTNKTSRSRSNKRSSEEAPLDDVDVPLIARRKRKRGERTTKEEEESGLRAAIGESLSDEDDTQLTHYETLDDALQVIINNTNLS